MIASVNRELCKVAATFRPDVVWFDKTTLFTPETIHMMHQGGSQIVFYVQDAPFGPRNDGCWWQFRKTYRIADLHCAAAGRYRPLSGLEASLDRNDVQLRPASAHPTAFRL